MQAELLAAYEAEPTDGPECYCAEFCPRHTRNEPDDEVRVGDRVRVLGETQEGTLECTGLVGVKWDDKSNFYRLHISALERVPLQLPSDHIDRFWIVGAWISRASDSLVVIKDDGVAIDLTTYGMHYKVDQEPTGWSFHPDSPVQEESNA
jgi:hypothetical protein